MDWIFLSQIARDIQIPISQPYNQVLNYKSLFIDSYIKIGNSYIEFSHSFGVAYSTFLNTNINSIKEKFKDKPVIADLTEIIDSKSNEKCILNINQVQDCLSHILDLFIIGRLDIKLDTNSTILTIPKNIVFPLIYILNILNADYHMEALLIYTLSHTYDKIFDKKFTGYSNDDRLDMLFYLILLITFEKTNPDIVYKFLSQNSGNRRFVDLLSLIKDYLTSEYLESVLPIIRKLALINSDQYIVISDMNDSIKFIGNYGITDKRRPEIKIGKKFDDKSNPLIIFDNKFSNFKPGYFPKTVTYQMIEDRLPIDINRTSSITIEGYIVSIMLPYMNLLFKDENTDDIPFYLFLVNISNTGQIYINKIQCLLFSDGLIIHSINPLDIDQMSIELLSNEIVSLKPLNNKSLDDLFNLSNHILNLSEIQFYIKSKILDTISKLDDLFIDIHILDANELYSNLDY